MATTKHWGVFDDPATDDAVYRMPLHHKLRYLRLIRELSHVDVGEQLAELLPHGLPSSRGLIARIEAQELTEADASPVLLAAIAQILRVPTAYLTPNRVDDVRRVADLTARP